MTQWLKDLSLLHRIVAVIHFLQGLFMLFGGRFIAEQYGWSAGIGGIKNIFGTWTLSYETEQKPSSKILQYKSKKLNAHPTTAKDRQQPKKCFSSRQIHNGRGRREREGEK